MTRSNREVQRQINSAPGIIFQGVKTFLGDNTGQRSGLIMTPNLCCIRFCPWSDQIRLSSVLLGSACISGDVGGSNSP